MNTPRSFFFNTVCGPSYGYGHLARCIAVAEKLLASGNKVTFPDTLFEDNLANSLLNESDIPQISQQISDFDFIIYDCYSECDKQSEKSGKVSIQFVDQTSIDFGCDAYVCVSPCDNWALQKPKLKAFDADPPLRSKFSFMNDSSGFVNSPRILFILGGSDQTALLNSVVEDLDATSVEFPVDIFVGSARKESLISASRIVFRGENESLFDVIQEYDLIMASAGVLAWELLALKKKVSFFSLVSNQDFQLEYLKALGCRAELQLSHDRKSFVNLVNEVVAFSSGRSTVNPELPISLKGSARIADYLLSLSN